MPLDQAALLYTYAAFGGIGPALIWLFFWLREDSRNPEPRTRLLFTFASGMLAVYLALILEKYVAQFFPYYGVISFTLWAIIEEGLKFLGASLSLYSKADDEPLDSLIYMITAAIGFAAMENTFFLQEIVKHGPQGSMALTTGALRFLGATLLHILASGTIGYCLASSFYRSKLVKLGYLASGFILAVAIHTSFNLAVYNQNGGGLLPVFTVLWGAVALLLLLFERVKGIAPFGNSNI